MCRDFLLQKVVGVRSATECKRENLRQNPTLTVLGHAI